MKQTNKIVSHKIDLLSKICKYITQYTAIIIYKTMVLPYFDYGDLIYAAANMCLLDKLQRLQNKALRIMSYYNPLISSSELHVSNELPCHALLIEGKLIC